MYGVVMRRQLDERWWHACAKRAAGTLDGCVAGEVAIMGSRRNAKGQIIAARAGSRGWDGSELLY